MKKRSIGLLALVLAIILVSIPVIKIYAFDKPNEMENNEESFVGVSSTVSIDSKIDIKLDLTKVQYSNFTIEITSNSDIANLSAENNIEVTKNESVAKIEINEETTLQEIELKYALPEGVKANDIIKFQFNVTDLDSESSEKFSAEVTVIDKDSTDMQTDSGNIDSNNNAGNNNEELNGGEFNTEELSKGEFNNSEFSNGDIANIQNNASFSNSTQETSMSSFSASSTTLGSVNTETEQVVYNGDCNNYLSSLSVSGYQFTKNFTKDNLTYFINADNVENLDITAIAESDSASVCIYGNDSISSGSKILISVTAENGDVRTYRIFINY